MASDVVMAEADGTETIPAAVARVEAAAKRYEENTMEHGDDGNPKVNAPTPNTTGMPNQKTASSVEIV